MYLVTHGNRLTAFKFHRSELWLPGKAIVILECTNRSKIFWMRKNNSSLFLPDKTLPEQCCSILVILGRLGETEDLKRKVLQIVKGLGIMQMKKSGM